MEDRRRAVVDSFVKLNPRKMMGNPVMFVVEIGSVITTVLLFRGAAAFKFNLQITLWLWFTVLFANFAEAMAEGRGKAQAETLRKARSETMANRLNHGRQIEQVTSAKLRAGDIVMVAAGEFIPSRRQHHRRRRFGRRIGHHRRIRSGDPRIRRRPLRCDRRNARSLRPDQSEITSNPGETFLDRMIALVEGAERQKTPNEIALNILLAGLTIIFLLAVVTLQPFAMYSGSPQTVFVLVSLLVCLIPTTIGGLLSAIGIAGMDRLIQHNVLAMSGRAVEAAGDVNTLLLDKTGTITLGNRQASRFYPRAGRQRSELADAAQLSSLADETPEGRSIVVLAKEKYGLRGRELSSHECAIRSVHRADPHVRREYERQSDSQRRRGCHYQVSGANSGAIPGRGSGGCRCRLRAPAARRWWLPKTRGALGVIELKDIVKGGMRERFDQLRAMGISTVMITGDNPLTAAAIAREAGVDDFLAQATPKDKMDLINREQAEGKLVAMTGDGTNDAPALAQADVGVAMNTGTQAAKEAGNMVDLDSNPTKLIEVVEIGKQLLMTRGSLTTFSIANDVAKYFAIIPAMFAGTFPVLNALNIMHLRTPQSAMLSAVIFNAVIIIALIPLALRGVKYRPMGAAALLRRNLWIYGFGGIIVPFIGIKLIDMLITQSGSGVSRN